jgi:hypothetical protein
MRAVGASYDQDAICLHRIRFARALASPIRLALQNSLENLVGYPERRPPEIGDCLDEVKQASFRSDFENAKSTRHKQPHLPGNRERAALVDEHSIRMKLLSQTDGLRLSGAKGKRWVDANWRSNLKPGWRGRRPSANDRGRAGVLQFVNYCGWSDDASEQQRQNVCLFDQHQIVQW